MERLLSSDSLIRLSPVRYRNAWLDKMTKQRIHELNQLSREEAERIQRLRYGGNSVTLPAD